MAENTVRKIETEIDSGTEQDFVESNKARLKQALDGVAAKIARDAEEKKETYLKDSEVPAGGE